MRGLGGMRGLRFPIRSGMTVKVAELDANEIAFNVVVGGLEPVVAVAVLPGGDAAPADDSGVKFSFFEQEFTGFRNQEWTVEILLIARRVEAVGFLLDGLGVGILGEDDVGVVGQPLAGFDEAEVEVVHHQVDGAAVGVAHVAFVGVAAHVEVEAGVAVVVEGTESHVARGTQAKPLSNSLDGECSVSLR